LKRRLLLKFLVLLPLAAVAKPADPVCRPWKGHPGCEGGGFLPPARARQERQGRSFFVFSNGDKSFQPLLDHPEKFKGRKVRVRWHKVTRVLEPAGPKPITFEEAVSIVFL